MLLALCILTGCTELVGGITVDVLVALESQVPEQLQTDQGYTVEPQASYVGLAVDELLPCEPDPGIDLGAVLRGLSPIGTAYAHTSNMGPQAGLIHIEDMGADRPEVRLGALYPAPGRYCGLRLRVGVPPEQQSATLYVEGLYSAPGGSSSTFRLRHFGERTRIVELPEPLELDEARLLGELYITLSYSRWFDGLSLESADEALLSERAADNAIRAVQGHAISL